MGRTAVRVAHLSKKYRIGGPQARYKTLRESLVDSLRAPQRWLNGEKKNPDETIWALNDVSFDIQKGEAVGIIGRNGAGKSTLLKLLSRITRPTSGRIELSGRVGSLLEVGTGFHPELTGRDNIYLNGAILGMHRHEIERKFDEIVAFSEIEKFLDTPVKRYSSGMYTRLAFSVAAHLEPEILVVDEVLAVGDAAFQKKCLGKMGDVAHEGRTVLFVSHNMAAIRTLCQNAILIEKGSILLRGSASFVTSEYLHLTSSYAEELVSYENLEKSPGDDRISLNFVKLSGNNGTIYNLNDPIKIIANFTVHKPIFNFHVFYNVYTLDGIHAFGSGSWDSLGLGNTQFETGNYEFECEIPPNLLNTGHYKLSMNGQIPGQGYIFEIDDILKWEMSNISGAGGAKSSGRKGVFRPLLEWHVDHK